MKLNLTTSERAARLVFAGLLLFAGLALFEHPLAKVAAIIFAIYAAWECAAGYCPAHAALGLKSLSDRKPEAVHLLALLAIQCLLAYEWLHAGWGKVSSPDFVRNLDKTFAAFAAKNPHEWYKGFLEGFATKNSVLFGYTIELSQLLIGLALVATATAIVYVKDAEGRRAASFVAAVALLGGSLMNANFYMASGWMSPSSNGLNLVMFWTQLILAYAWISSTERSK
jgi:hypothetical protein